MAGKKQSWESKGRAQGCWCWRVGRGWGAYRGWRVVSQMESLRLLEWRKEMGEWATCCSTADSSQNRSTTVPARIYGWRSLEAGGTSEVTWWELRQWLEDGDRIGVVETGWQWGREGLGLEAHWLQVFCFIGWFILVCRGEMRSFFDVLGTKIMVEERELCQSTVEGDWNGLRSPSPLWPCFYQCHSLKRITETFWAQFSCFQKELT